MTHQPVPLERAVDEHDVTLALSPVRLLLAAIALWLLLRFLRGLRRRPS